MSRELPVVARTGKTGGGSAITGNMAKRLLSELQIGEDVSEVFAVTRFEFREYQNGRYLRLRLADASGKMNAVMWDGSAPAEAWLREGVLAQVDGKVGQYRNAPQVTVGRLREVQNLDDLDLADFMPITAYDQADMAFAFISIINSVPDPDYRALMNAVVEDRTLFHDFCKHPAAKRWHHAHIGGLLEHTLSVLEICRRVVPFYRDADPSLLLCGALFHDLGKIEELEAGYTITYTDKGRLLGHILLGELMLERLAVTIPNLPQRKLDLIRHLILSHHGDEAHSPCKPQSLEANILHYIENMDAQLNAMTREVLLARKEGQTWSPYIPLLDRYLYAGGDLNA